MSLTFAAARSRVSAIFSHPEWPRLRREGLWVFVGQAFAALAGLATIRLMTHIADPGIYGEVSLLMAGLTLGRYLFLSPVFNSQTRHHSEFEQMGLGNWYSHEIDRMSWIATVMFTASCVLIFIGANAIYPGFLRWSLILPLLACIQIETPKLMRLNRLNAERRQARFAAWQIVEAWLTLASIASFFLIYETAEGWLAGQAAATLAALVFCGFLNTPRYPPDTGGEYPGGRAALLRKTLAYGLPFVTIGTLGWALQLSDRYILGNLTGVAEVGLYAASTGVAGRPMSLISAFLATLVRPVLFEAESAGNAPKARAVFWGWLGITTAAVAATILLFVFAGEWVASLLLGPKYQAGARDLMCWVALAHGVLPVIQVLEVRLMSYGRTGGLIWPQLLGAATTVTATIMLVPKLGVIGAGQARAAASVVQFMATWLLLALPTRKA